MRPRLASQTVAPFCVKAVATNALSGLNATTHCEPSRLGSELTSRPVVVSQMCIGAKAPASLLRSRLPSGLNAAHSHRAASVLTARPSAVLQIVA